MSAAESGGVSQESIDAMLAAARAAASDGAAEADEAEAGEAEAEPALDIDAILAANDPEATAEQDAPPSGPMSLADRLAAMGMSVPDDEPAPPPAEEPASGGTLSQAAIDAMRARAAAAGTEPEASDAGASGGTLSQAAIDAMRARAAAADAEPEASDAGGAGGALSQAAIDAMRARAAAEPEAEEQGRESGEISLEELLSAGVTPGQPLPGSEALAGATLEALLASDGLAGAATPSGEPAHEPGDGVEISVAELLAAGIKAVPRGPRAPKAPAARTVAAPEAPPAAPVEDFEEPPNLRLMMDVSVEITAEIGSINMPMDELLSLYTGTILSLNTHAEEPVRLLANGLPLALGEVVVVDEKFGVRVTGLAASAEVAV